MADCTSSRAIQRTVEIELQRDVGAAQQLVVIESIPAIVTTAARVRRDGRGHGPELAPEMAEL